MDTPARVRDDWRPPADPILEPLKQWVRAARQSQRAIVLIRRSLPIQGKIWHLEGDRTDGRPILCIILRAFASVENSINPQHLAADARPRIDAAYHLFGEEYAGQPLCSELPLPDMLIATQTLVRCFDRVVEHYGWSNAVRPDAVPYDEAWDEAEAFRITVTGLGEGENRPPLTALRWSLRCDSWGWTWPAPPPVDPAVLDALFGAAAEVIRIAAVIKRRGEGCLIPLPLCESKGRQAAAPPASPAERQAKMVALFDLAVPLAQEGVPDAEARERFIGGLRSIGAEMSLALEARRKKVRREARKSGGAVRGQPTLFGRAFRLLLRAVDAASYWMDEPPGPLPWLILDRIGRAALLMQKAADANTKTQKIAAQPTSEKKADTTPARHSKDFRSVHWYGTDYFFTENQAAVVAELWKGWENGTPDVGHRTLLGDAKLETDRLGDVFKEKGKAHPAWGTMIRTSVGSKGSARLWSPKP